MFYHLLLLLSSILLHNILDPGFRVSSKFRLLSLLQCLDDEAIRISDVQTGQCTQPNTETDQQMLPNVLPPSFAVNNERMQYKVGLNYYQKMKGQIPSTTNIFLNNQDYKHNTIRAQC